MGRVKSGGQTECRRGEGEAYAAKQRDIKPKPQFIVSRNHMLQLHPFVTREEQLHGVESIILSLNLESWILPWVKRALKAPNFLDIELWWYDFTSLILLFNCCSTCSSLSHQFTPSRLP